MRIDPNKKHIEVCITPENYHLYEEYNEIVVVIDVLRATSAICTAFDYGVKSIIPVSTIEEARDYKSKGYIVAAERNGEIVEGFDLGNSPFGFMQEHLKGESVVLTTTNGTKCINMARNGGQVVIGSLLNLDALANWLKKQDKNILILCSGWKGKFNLEDSICAGAIAEQLLESNRYQSVEDSSIAAKYLYIHSKQNYLGFLKASSHRRRLKKLNMNADIKLCLIPNQSEAIPVLQGNEIVNVNVKKPREFKVTF